MRLTETMVRALREAEWLYQGDTVHGCIYAPSREEPGSDELVFVDETEVCALAADWLAMRVVLEEMRERAYGHHQKCRVWVGLMEADCDCNWGAVRARLNEVLKGGVE